TTDGASVPGGSRVVGLFARPGRRLPLVTRRVMLYSMIRSIRDRDTERLAQRERVKTWSPQLQKAALRKLRMIDAAEEITDLRVPPGNRLERLKGNRAGQYSIRINDQWRVCF